MGTFMNTLVVVLFVLFMIFILGGYHKTKSQEREKDKNLKD